MQIAFQLLQAALDGKCVHLEWRMHEAGPLAVRNYVWPKEEGLP